jgi:hypothetical protein
MPQLRVSVSRLVQVPPHVTEGAAQVHEPPTQVRPLLHAVPQRPQLAASVIVLTQAPPQSVVPPAQAQAPPTQLCPVGQARPHIPQLALSLVGSTQAVPHISRGAAHALTHAPATHD